MKRIHLSEIMTNREVANIIDSWHYDAGFSTFSGNNELYLLDEQDESGMMTPCSILHLAVYWLQILENRQSIHSDQEALVREQKQIEILRSFVLEERKHLHQMN